MKKESIFLDMIQAITAYFVQSVTEAAQVRCPFRSASIKHIKYSHSFGKSVRCVFKCALYNCFRAKCGWKGHVGTHVDLNVFERFKKSENRVEKPNPRFQPLDAECIEFFKLR